MERWKTEIPIFKTGFWAVGCHCTWHLVGIHRSLIHGKSGLKAGVARPSFLTTMIPGHL